MCDIRLYVISHHLNASKVSVCSKTMRWHLFSLVLEAAQQLPPTEPTTSEISSSSPAHLITCVSAQVHKSSCIHALQKVTSSEASSIVSSCSKLAQPSPMSSCQANPRNYHEASAQTFLPRHNYAVPRHSFNLSRPLLVLLVMLLAGPLDGHTSLIGGAGA